MLFVLPCSILSLDFIHLVIIFVYTHIKMCVRICYLHRNVHEDLSSSLIIQKSAIYEVEHQPRFYALNFVANSRNMEFIVMIRNITTVDRGSFLR